MAAPMSFDTDRKQETYESGEEAIKSFDPTPRDLMNST